MHLEYLPVSVDVLVGKRYDALIYSLAQDFVKEGILSMPETGATIEGGEILMRRDEMVQHDTSSFESV